MNPADMYVFKVPGLRNVAMEPLYFHDGSVRTLLEAVRIMARVQLGKTLSDQDTNTIVAFLNSLTGKLPQNFVEAPVLPPGGFARTQSADVEAGIISASSNDRTEQSAVEAGCAAWGTCEYSRSGLH
jgi:hypothetical protein